MFIARYRAAAAVSAQEEARNDSRTSRRRCCVSAQKTHQIEILQKNKQEEKGGSPKLSHSARKKLSGLTLVCSVLLVRQKSREPKGCGSAPGAYRPKHVAPCFVVITQKTHTHMVPPRRCCFNTTTKEKNRKAAKDESFQNLHPIEAKTLADFVRCAQYPVRQKSHEPTGSGSAPEGCRPKHVALCFVVITQKTHHTRKISLRRLCSNYKPNNRLHIRYRYLLHTSARIVRNSTK